MRIHWNSLRITGGRAWHFRAVNSNAEAFDEPKDEIHGEMIRRGAHLSSGAWVTRSRETRRRKGWPRAHGGMFKGRRRTAKLLQGADAGSGQRKEGREKQDAAPG